MQTIIDPTQAMPYRKVTKSHTTDSSSLCVLLLVLVIFVVILKIDLGKIARK